MAARPLMGERRSWRKATLALVASAHAGGLALALLGHPLPAIALVCASHLLLLWGTLHPSSRLLGPVLTHFPTEAREVWLTIDDGPSSDTQAVIDVLQRHRAPATWFMVGERVRASPEKLRAVLAAGHQVGNHSDSHPAGWFWALPPRSLGREIERAQRSLAELGVRPALFRAVVGMANPFVAPLLARHGLVRVGWSARGFDATTPDPDTVVRRIVSDLRPGAIILVHEGAAHGRSVEIIARVLEALHARGYRCVLPTISDPPRPASC